jgi:phage head maturation protease
MARMRANDLIGRTAERTMKLSSRTLDDGRRVYRASLSSEQPVQQWFGVETLKHSKSAINLERAARGLPLLYNHNPDALIGRVRGIRVDARAKKLRADEIEFSPHSDLAREMEANVKDGFAGDVSLRYSIDDTQLTRGDDGAEQVLVTRWTPREISLATIPADHTVGIGRTLMEGTSMAKKTPDTSNVRAINSEAESQRLAEIQVWRDLGQSTFRSLPAGTVDRLCDIAVAKGQTGDQVRQAIATKLAEQEPEATVSRMGPDRPTPLPSFISGGEPHSELGPACVDALLMRGGVPIESPHPGAADLRNRRVVDIAELILRSHGVAVRDWSPQRMIGEALQMRTLIGHGSSDFSGILANVASKALIVGFLEASSQHRRFVRLGTLRDFKSARRVSLADFSDLDTIPEAGEYKHGTYGEQSASIVATKWGKLFAITREALVNDDTAAFSQVPRGMAAAAARTERDAVFDALVSGTAPDGNDIWTGHSNTGTGAAPSVTTLDEARKLMAVQTGPGGAVLNMQPKFLICPAALRTTCDVLVASTFNPAEGATTSFTAPNPFQGQLEVISDAYLDGSSTTAYYLAADPMQRDTIEVAHVGGAAEPYLETRDGWTVDGVEYKVRFEFGVSILDWRGLVKNAGA